MATNNVELAKEAIKTLQAIRSDKVDADLERRGGKEGILARYQSLLEESGISPTGKYSEWHKLIPELEQPLNFAKVLLEIEVGVTFDHNKDQTIEFSPEEAWEMLSFWAEVFGLNTESADLRTNVATQLLLFNKLLFPVEPKKTVSNA